MFSLEKSRKIWKALNKNMLALKNRIKGISNAFDLWSKADLIQGFVVSPWRLIVPQSKKLQREKRNSTNFYIPRNYNWFVVGLFVGGVFTHAIGIWPVVGFVFGWAIVEIIRSILNKSSN